VYTTVSNAAPHGNDVLLRRDPQASKHPKHPKHPKTSMMQN
ncbi:17279_t:CDS:1, partial [Funneliformis caledonium]